MFINYEQGEIMNTKATVLLGMFFLVAGMVWATFFKTAPYSIFAPSVVALGLGNTYKRLQQKKVEYNGR